MRFIVVVRKYNNYQKIYASILGSYYKQHINRLSTNPLFDFYCSDYMLFVVYKEDIFLTKKSNYSEKYFCFSTKKVLA